MPKKYSPDKFRLKTYRLAFDAPKIQLDELVSAPMTSDHLFEPEPPQKPHNSSPVIRTLSPPPEHVRSPTSFETPKRHPNHDRRQESLSPSPSTRALSPPALDVDTSSISMSPMSDGETPQADSANPWSAVGRATTGGKSGRVIERLMNDNDRLQREKKLAIVKLDEEVKRGESARSALDSLQLSNANLTAMHESDTTLLAKRDRRIQQLRDDLLVERARREEAEKETRETKRERDETIETLRREAAETREQSFRATNQYDMVSKSFKGLDERYAKQTKNLQTDLVSLKVTIRGDKQRLEQMEVVMEQMAKEAERTRRAKEKLVAEFEAYKSEQDEATRHIREMARHQDETTDTTHQQMMDALGHMKYVINIKRDLREMA